MRLIRVHLKLVWRWIVRRLTGRYTTVHRPDPQTVIKSRLAELMRAVTPAFGRQRRENNRDLLTGMVVALIARPNIAPWSGWEYYRAHLSRRATNAKKGIPTKLVGWPAIYKHSGPNRVTIGLTSFIQDYVPRQEQLAEKKAAKLARRAARISSFAPLKAAA